MAFEADDIAARLRAEFPRALRERQVVGYFQPEVELATGRLVAAELLARWDHPELGTLQPSSFIPLAEELGLMTELSLALLGQSLVQHKAWAAAGWLVPVSVNIGPGCVADPDFPAAVSRLLREEQVPGQMIVLEVSEETGTTAASTRFFAQLAESGVQISLDDFGTGFASLESLGGWPINELKLDMSIVRPIVSSTSFAAIVRTTIDLAHQLGVKVVAEGVESAAICSELRALGCDIGQGFYLGRPMSAAAFTEWMSDPDRPVMRLDAAGYPQPSPSLAADPGGLPSTAIGRTVREVRRVVQRVGGGTLACAALVLTVYGLWQVFRWGGREHQAFIGDLAFIPVNGAAIVLAWRVSRRPDFGHRACRAWRLLSVAVFLYLLGDLLQFWYENVLHRAAYPTWADAAYLSFYVVGFAGLVSFPARRRSGPERLRLLLDLGTVFTGGVIVTWYLALGPAIGSGPRFDLFDIVTYAYPVGDLLLLFGILTLLWRGVPPSNVTALRIFAGGVLIFIAADLSYDYITVHSTYLGGDPVDMLWMVAVTFVCISAASQLRTPPTGTLVPPPQQVVSGRPSPLPYVAVVSSYVLLAFVGLRSVGFNPLGGILLGAAVLTFMVSTRQYIALRDYGRLAVRYQQLAAIDGITGLYNRRHFMETAEAAFAHAQRLGQPFVALMIDVDNFKRINDVHGHIAGDQVLTELAQVSREHVRPDDIVGRYGGDEFIIMMPGVTTLRAIQLAGQLTRLVTRFHGSDGKHLAYSASIGIAESPPDGDLTTLLMHADLAMYEAKEAGGGGWRIFGDATGSEAVGAEAARRVGSGLPSARRQSGLTGTNDVTIAEQIE
ncbi:MAG: GGDEF domain-containing protein [Trebonia sp.]|jgi:diguanylate cyclase (GGDEF)-like protein